MVAILSVKREDKPTGIASIGKGARAALFGFVQAAAYRKNNFLKKVE
jgi:hypothetical protein